MSKYKDPGMNMGKIKKNSKNKAQFHTKSNIPKDRGLKLKSMLKC
jgi:hypothetical protein